MTKVVQVHYRSSTSGDFSRRLHDELTKAGISSSMLYLYSELPNGPTQRNLGYKERLLSRLDDSLNTYIEQKSDKQFGRFSHSFVGTNIAKLEEVKQADVIYLHYILRMMTLRNIEQLAKLGKPIVFILHDMWSISGGCHYSFDCDKYKTKCYDCQIFKGSKRRDLSAIDFERKLKLYKKYSNLYFVSPSRWLYECAQQSALTRDKPVHYIPNVLDRSLFKPINKKIAKEILNINADDQVILFGAALINSPFKGWEYLKSSLRLLHAKVDPDKILVLLFGGGNQAEIEKNIPFRTRFMGRLSDEYTIALTYNAADVFVAPSLADNLPYTIFESLACATPVVAFNTGGIPDLIRHKNNGYLAAYKNAEEVAEGIHYCLTQPLDVSPPSDLDNDQSIQKHLALLESIQSIR